MSYLLCHSWVGNDRHELRSLTGSNRDVREECSVRRAPESERQAPAEVVSRLDAEVEPVGGQTLLRRNKKSTFL